MYHIFYARGGEFLVQLNDKGSRVTILSVSDRVTNFHQLYHLLERRIHHLERVPSTPHRIQLG